MSSINNVGGNSPIYGPNKVAPKTTQPSTTTDAAAPNRGPDKLELSGTSHLMKTLKAGGDVRMDKVAAIRAQIEAGTYEDDHKLDVTADRLLDEIA